MLVEPLRRHPCQAPVCKYTTVSAIASGFGACTWDGSPGGTVSGWPFLQSLLHFCPSISFRQEQFWVKNFEIPQLQAIAIYWRWSLQVPSPYCWAFQLRSSPLSTGTLLPPGSLILSRGSPHLPHPRSYIFPFILLSLWSSLLFFFFPYLTLLPVSPPLFQSSSFFP